MDHAKPEGRSTDMRYRRTGLITGKVAVKVMVVLFACLMMQRMVGIAAEPQNIEKIYFASDYEWLEDEDSVFRALTWEELTVLFEQEGNYLILFGGPWCTNTTPVIGYINEVAKEYGVTAIYTFDLRLDGATSDTHIRESNGATKKNKEVTGSLYNYLYGELAERYLTNLNDYVEYSLDSADALTYTDAGGAEVIVPKVQVPFLFLYNKDNKAADGTLAPIVTGLELMKTREDFLYVDGSVDQELVDEYEEILRESVFETVKDTGVSDFTDADYIRLIYNQKSGKEIFAESEQINIEVINYRQLQWMLKQGEGYLIFFGGSWSEETQSYIAEINSYAVDNEITVYNFDPRLDGGYAVEYWGYTKELDIRESSNEFARLYTDLVKTYLNGEEIPFPYLFSYTRSETDENGHKISSVSPVNIGLDETSQEITENTAQTAAEDTEAQSSTGIIAEDAEAESAAGIIEEDTEADSAAGILREDAETESAVEENTEESAGGTENQTEISTMESRVIAAGIIIAVVGVTLIIVTIQEKRKGAL